MDTGRTKMDSIPTSKVFFGVFKDGRTIRGIDAINAAIKKGHECQYLELSEPETLKPQIHRSRGTR